jgi:hypothetical protein
MSHRRLGAAGTTPGLLRLSLVAVVEEVTPQIDPQMEMSLHLEGPVATIATITGANALTTPTVAELPGTTLVHVNHLVTVFGGMASMSSEDAMRALRRSSTVMPKIPPNSTLASTLKSMMIFPSKRPVLVSPEAVTAFTSPP